MTCRLFDERKIQTMSGTNIQNCTHCGICRDNCAFLSKYGIDIGDTERLKELAYHCFLCGYCTDVCPEHIDGRQAVLDLRRERVASGEKKAVEKKYRGLIREKRDYIYRNWKHATGGSVFFPGCNFPSMYPKTTAEIVKIFREHGIGTLYECCGKPIAELGLAEDEERIIQNIRKRLNDNKITEIITGCPNCRDFFGDRLGIKVTGIFSKFSELGIGNTLEGDFVFYIPCPDRTERIWIEEIRPFIKGNITFAEGVQCCGLGGCAIAYEPDLADMFTQKLKEQTSGAVTYCASCTGQFRRCGLDRIDHIVTKILGTDERADTSKSYVNRVLTKFK